MPVLYGEEKRIIRALKMMAKRWPRNLWLKTDENCLRVYRLDVDGNRAVCGPRGSIDVDEAYLVDTIDIPSGNW